MIDNNYLSLSYENEIYEKLKIDYNSDYDEQFSNLLKNTDVISVLIMNKLISKISNFEDQCIKYYNLLNECFKKEMNKNITITNYNDLIITISSLSNFFKIFSLNYQSYNDKFKSILKQIPQFLQLFFKLLKSNFETYFNLSFNNNKPKILETFFILIITFINYYPNNMRPYQKTIESFLKQIFELFIFNLGKINLYELKTYFITYTLLYRLSPQLSQRLQEKISNIILNIKFFIEFFKPKNINDNNENLKNNFELIFDIQKLNQTNLIQANKIIILLFNFLETIFITIPNEKYFSIDFKEIFEFFLKEINDYSKLNNKFMGITLNGLSKKEYEIFSNNLNNLVLTSLTFFLDNYSHFLISHFELIGQIYNKLLINESYLKNTIIYSSLLKCFISFIKTFNLYLPEIIDEIIFHFVYSSFPTVYFEFLEVNDKTVVKIENSYIKLSDLKSKNKIKNNTHSIVTSPEKIFQTFTKKEMEEILYLYLELLENFINIEYYYFNKNNRALFSGLIDLLILPSYSKFIFFINDSIKNKILNIIDISSKNNKCDFNKWKLFQFLNGFFTNNKIVSNQINNIINNLNLKDNEIYDNNENNLTGQILDLNIKLSELIKQTEKSFEEKNELKKKRKLSNENEMNINKKRKIEETQFNQNNLNIEEESLNPKITRELNKDENILISNNNEENNNIKENDNEEEDIEIPEII